MLLRTSAIIALLFLATPAFAQVPGPPTTLASSVSGSTVTLTWSAPGTGGVPTGYVVEASFTPGGAIIASLQVGGTTLVVPNVPSGLYYVRVRALNGAGASGPSNEIAVSVSGGCPGPPNPPENVRLRAVGQSASVTWTPPTTGCGATSYILLAGSAPGTSDIAQANTGGGLGLNAIAPPGRYYVRVVSVNQWGVSAPSFEMRTDIAVNNFTDTLQPSQAVAFDITMSATGNYLGVLSWIDPAINLDFYLATAGCPYPPGPAGCLLSSSRAQGVNTEQVTRSVGAGEIYRLWIDNFSPLPTSFTIQNFIGGAGTPVGPAAVTAPASGGGSQ